MAGAEELREGMDIMVRCRVGKVYWPPAPALVTLIPARRSLRALPSVLVYADDIEWWSLQDAPPAHEAHGSTAAESGAVR